VRLFVHLSEAALAGRVELVERGGGHAAIVVEHLFERNGSSRCSTP
jgi:hypothetical protein